MKLSIDNDEGLVSNGTIYGHKIIMSLSAHRGNHVLKDSACAALLN